MPRAFLDGVRLFNSGQYFEAHEAFEELLDAVETDERWDLLVALVQVAVGYHKCASGYVGGAKMLGSGLEKLAGFDDDAAGVAVGALRERVLADRTAIVAGVPAATRLVDPPRIGLVSSVDWSRD